MAKTPMPEVTGDGECGGGGVALVAMKGVKVAGAIGAKEDLPGKKILQRETKRVKFNRTIVIADKFTCAAEVLDNGWRNKNVIKEKGARGEMSSTGGNNWEARPITNNYMVRIVI